MERRAGTTLIFAIALSALLVVLGYGFLRAVRLDQSASDSSHLAMLARSAAQSGSTDAIEAIVTDYALPTQVIGTGNNSSVTMAAPTYLDGPWRAPFTSQYMPNRVLYLSRGATTNDDVDADNLVLNPLIRWHSDDRPGRLRWCEADDGDSNLVRPGLACQLHYDGRGRYVEVGYRNVDRPTPVGTSAAPARPTTPVRFSDGAGAPLAAPAGRAHGLFLDHEFHRINSGTPLADRANARYRLRYAVGVEDLGGHLLCNPLADATEDWRDPNASFRHPPAWLEGAQQAWYNIISCLGQIGNNPQELGMGATTALRYEHVFLGRGNTANVDRKVSAVSGFPVTFPNMFRNQADYQWRQFSSAAGEFNDPQGLANIGFPEAPTLMLGNPAGGEEVNPFGAQNTPFVAANFGPQHSWYNHHYSVMGLYTWNVKGSVGADGSTIIRSTAGGLSEGMFVGTPFQHRLVKKATPAKWYEGKVDCPWYVNLLTAPPTVIHAMVMAYVPGPAKLAKLTSEKYQNGSSIALSPARGWVFWRGRDLFTSLSSPLGLAYYAPPTIDGVTPNFHKRDPRTAAQRYPGQSWYQSIDASADPTKDLADDFGRDVMVYKFDASGASLSIVPRGRDSHSGQVLVADPVTTLTWYPANPHPPMMPAAGTVPAGDTQYLWTNNSGGLVNDTFKANDSYWLDMVQAFSVAVAFTRAQWVQFPNDTLSPSHAVTSAPGPVSNLNPTVGFSPVTLRDPTRFSSIEAVDRQFVSQLGENWDAPGSDPTSATYQPVKPMYAADSDPRRRHQYAPLPIADFAGVRIRTISDGTKSSDPNRIVKAKVAEKVLNDFRMSFLGASPQYTAAFRPLDFDGDGKVQCSGYPAKGNVADQADGIDNWDMAVGSGRGPVIPDNYWFSLTGCFYIGKSHYYRVFSRGEVYDSIIAKQTADATLETVIAVDPEDTLDGAASGMDRTQVLFQRWHYDRNTIALPRQER